MVIRLCFSSVLLLLVLQPRQVVAQELIDIEERIAWEMGQDDMPVNSTVVFSPHFSVEAIRGKVDSTFISLFTGGSYMRVVRLLDGENILLLGIPHFGPNIKCPNPIFAVQYLVNEATRTFTRESDFAADDGYIFGNVVHQDMLMQKPPKPYFRNIDVKIFASEPEELHIELSNGDYGDATLIFTPLSAHPKVVKE